MRERTGMWQRTRTWLGAMAALIVCGWVVRAGDGLPLQDPVEPLRQVLQDTTRDPAGREQALRACLPALGDAGDLRRALELREWCDRGLDGKVAAVDRGIRRLLAERFATTIRAALGQKDATLCLAVTELLADMGVSIRAANGSHGLAHDFGADLANLTRSGPPELRAAAARALGQINADPSVAVPALSTLMESGDDGLRLAGTDGLQGVLRTACFLVSRPPDLSGVEVTRADWVRAACAALPFAGRGLGDPSPEIRRRCAETIRLTAATLADLVPDPKKLDEVADPAGHVRQVEAERAELRPVFQAFREQGLALSQAVADADVGVREQAHQALEALVDTQGRVRRRAESLAGFPGVRGTSDLRTVGYEETTSGGATPPSEELRRALSALTTGLAAANPKDRRAAVEALEALGQAARPAAPALIQTLADRDPFVRWAAARALRRIGPTEGSVPAFCRLLWDRDMDVRLAAVAALESYGRYAFTAVPALVEGMASQDAELRVAIVHALGRIGPEVALARLAAALSDPDARVRREAAQVLGSAGAGTPATLEALRRALHDEDADVRRAASDALVHILQGKQ